MKTEIENCKQKLKYNLRRTHMINPITIMKIINERAAFITNHPDFYSFLHKGFGTESMEDSVIEIRITKSSGEVETGVINVQETDLPLFNAVKEFLNQKA